MERQELDSFYDQTRLRSEAYADSKNLVARADIYRFAVPDIAFPSWALSHLSNNLGVSLDVGCGPGFYLRKIYEAGSSNQLFGVDLSDGMLREVQSRIASLCVADAQSLPFGDKSFDTVLCMHVLYHVPDIALAVAEFRRVLKPDGYLLVATNGPRHQQRLREVLNEAVPDTTATSPAKVWPEHRFDLDKGQGILGTHFHSVERFDLARELIVPEAEPVVRYLASTRSLGEERLPEGVTWDEVQQTFRGIVEREIEEKGAFRTPIHAGVFVCK
ncbi:MAG: class I SAM-dependent methyltransferase [Actinobacteria bacterium]|nr:class I SAM-dependent methyltransferase [Actinomycetota bacterium]